MIKFQLNNHLSLMSESKEERVKYWKTGGSASMLQRRGAVLLIQGKQRKKDSQVL